MSILHFKNYIPYPSISDWFFIGAHFCFPFPFIFSYLAGWMYSVHFKRCVCLFCVLCKKNLCVYTNFTILPIMDIWVIFSLGLSWGMLQDHFYPLGIYMGVHFCWIHNLEWNLRYLDSWTKIFPREVIPIDSHSGGCSACLLITYFGHAEMNVLNIPYGFNLYFPEDWTPFHVFVGRVIAFSWGNWIPYAFFSCLFSFWKQAVLQLPSPILELVFSFY